MATKIFMKLNTIQPPSLPPDDTNMFNQIMAQLNEWLALLPNLIHSLVAKFNDRFPPETRPSSPWAIAAIGAALLLFCWCCLPGIIRCITGVVRAWWNCVKGLLSMVWRMCKKVLRCFCCCCSCRCLDDDDDRDYDYDYDYDYYDDEFVRRMMIAPGTQRGLSIPRSVFENNPQRYFANLRAGTVRMNYY